MKLEDLERDRDEVQVLKPTHMAGTSILSIIRGNKRYIYLTDPVSGEVQRRTFNIGSHPEIVHGMGAVGGE